MKREQIDTDALFRFPAPPALLTMCVLALNTYATADNPEAREHFLGQMRFQAHSPEPLAADEMPMARFFLRSQLERHALERLEHPVYVLVSLDIETGCLEARIDPEWVAFADGRRKAVFTAFNKAFSGSVKVPRLA
jgi:hypothetical protein